tara:strand:- start:61 stop:504 length:444 start_codon:yes stop_codon:yes gene_type:complete
MAKYHREGEIPQERLIELVKNHLNISISHDMSDWSNVDCRVYSESTADGYDLFVVTQNLDHPIICEDCYQYDHDITDAVKEEIRYGANTFYIDLDIYNECYMEDMLLEMFADYVEDIIEDDELNITLSEINKLKEEYGLTEEEIEPF